MSRDEANALMAFKNAWLGAMTTGEEVAALGPAVANLPDDTAIAALDYDTYYRILGAHANAIMGVRGLLDDLTPKEEPTT
jgi:hypothetical protein